MLRKDKNFGPKVDVYSYGIILWELWTNLDPGFMFTHYQVHLQTKHFIALGGVDIFLMRETQQRV